MEWGGGSGLWLAVWVCTAPQCLRYCSLVEPERKKKSSKSPVAVALVYLWCYFLLYRWKEPHSSQQGSQYGRHAIQQTLCLRTACVLSYKCLKDTAVQLSSTQQHQLTISTRLSAGPQSPQNVTQLCVFARCWKLLSNANPVWLFQMQQHITKIAMLISQGGVVVLRVVHLSHFWNNNRGTQCKLLMVSLSPFKGTTKQSNESLAGFGRCHLQALKL